MPKKKTVLSSLPKKEIRWVKEKGPDGYDYYTTSSQDRTQYYLYKYTGDFYECIAHGNSPVNFSSLVRNQKKH